MFCKVLGAQWMFEGASSAETPPPFLSALLFPLPSPFHPQERTFEQKIKAGDRLESCKQNLGSDKHDSGLSHRLGETKGPPPLESLVADVSPLPG